MHGLLWLAGLRGSITGANELLRALAVHRPEFDMLAASYPACRAWVTVFGTAGDLAQGLEGLLAEQVDGIEADSARLRSLLAPTGFGGDEAQPATASALPGDFCGAPFTRFMRLPPDNRMPPIQRLLRAACYLIGVMRQASHHQLVSSGDEEDAWLDELVAGAAVLAHPLPDRVLGNPGAPAGDFLLAMISTLNASDRSVAENGSGPQPASLAPQVEALTMLRKLLRHKGATELGLQVQEHFRAGSVAKPEPASDSPASEGAPAADTNGSSGADGVDANDDDEHDVEADADADADGAGIFDQDSEEEDDDAEDDAVDQDARQPAARGAPSAATSPSTSGDSKTVGKKKQRREWRWGDQPSSVLPEQFLLAEHWWALDPAEMADLTSWVERCLNESPVLHVGCRPPTEFLFDGLAAAVGLAMGLTLEGAFSLRLVSDRVDADLERRRVLPPVRYARLETHTGGRFAGASIGFPPGDRYRAIWAEGVAEPLDLPEALGRRLGQLAGAVLDAEFQELLPFVPGGWVESPRNL